MFKLKDLKMKKVIPLLLIVLTTTSVMAQNKNAKETIKVDGVCEMCKKRIEKAALQVKGVKFALWNVETHELNLVLDERKTTVKEVQKNIAQAGHDTPLFIATDEAYNSVNACCRYRDRQVIESHNHDN